MGGERVDAARSATDNVRIGVHDAAIICFLQHPIEKAAQKDAATELNDSNRSFRSHKNAPV
jgi:hypothetical protein